MPGENVLREWRGKTQVYISHKAGIGLGYISDLADEDNDRGFEENRGVLKIPLDLIA